MDNMDPVAAIPGSESESRRPGSRPADPPPPDIRQTQQRTTMDLQHTQQNQQNRTFSFSLENMPVNINAQAQLSNGVGNVLREFMPSLERRIPPIAINQHGHEHNPQPRLLNPDQPPTPNSDSYVLDLDNPDETHADGNDQSPAQNQQQANWRAIAKLMEKSGIFLVILLAKLSYNHRLGILVTVGLFTSFYHASSTLKKQISSIDGRNMSYSSWHLIWVIFFTAINIFFIYFIFEDQELYKSLYFQLPDVKDNHHIDFWTLMWIVTLTDFVLKFAAISLKAMVALLPKYFLPYKRRGKYYMFIEEVIQMYRSLTPIVPWIYFLINYDHGGQWFSQFIFLLYFVCKVNVLWSKLKDVINAFKKVRIDVAYGTLPSSEQIKTAGDSCPICHDDFTDPILLSCKHIFCEDCVSMWFDREQTCPMCRAKIADNPAWRDGSTNGFIQWF